MPIAARKSLPISGNLFYLRELKRKYRYLYQEKPRACPDGTFAFHQARLARREGIHVLFLRGDSYEMMFQHGKLLKEAIRRGVLTELNRMIPNVIHNSVTKNALLNKVLTRALDYLGNNVLLHNISKDDLKDTFALSEGAGLPLETISGALLSIEALSILAKYAVRSKGIHVHPMAFSGCSSFAAWGKHTTHGDLLIGRNLDYQLNGFFDAEPLVAYHEPTDGTQAYVSIGSAGLHTPSLTAFNQSGIFLAVHMAPSAETSFGGTPIYFIGSEVIRKARSFDEAVEIFRRSHPTAGWSFLLASFREKRVASVEMTYEHMAVREAESCFHAQTNHFLHPEMRSSNLHINLSIDRDSCGRLQRMRDLVQSMGRIDAKGAAEILGDPFDPWEKRVRGLGATLAVHITVGSAVFCPGEGKFYVANGMAPVSQNDYVEFPWLGGQAAEGFAGAKYEVIGGGKFRAEEPSMAEALQRYIEAKVLYENHSEPELAYESMLKVVELDPGNAAYRFVLALFACKTGRFTDGKRHLGSVLTMDHTVHLHHLATYYLGRVQAHLGEKVPAIASYELLLGDAAVDEKLRSAARSARNRLRLFGSHSFPADRLPLLMQFADLLSY